MSKLKLKNEFKDKIYAPCILLSRLKFRFDGKESSIAESPKCFESA